MVRWFCVERLERFYWLLIMRLELEFVRVIVVIFEVELFVYNFIVLFWWLIWFVGEWGFVLEEVSLNGSLF